MFCIYLRKKEIQKYTLNLKDLIYVFLLGLIVIIFGGLNYGYPVNIKYETTDPATHYRATSNFANSDSLLNLKNDNIYLFKNWKIGSYVNSGLIMKVFSDVMDEFDYYKIFIIFGLFILFMTGYMMYVALVKISKGKLAFVAFIISLLFMLGYPLNSLLFGFEYMSMGILIVVALLYAVEYYASKEINFKHIIVIIFLLTFQLFHSYYQFVPYIFSALFIYICFINYKEDKKIFTKKNILTLCITLIIPFILGFIYYFAQGIYNLDIIFSSTGLGETVEDIAKRASSTQNSILSTFSLYGYVYNNLYAGIILLLPLIIYVIIKDIREKRTIDFSSMAVIITLGYIGLLVIGNHIGKVSDYYVTKNYFALFVLLWYINFKGIYYLYNKKKIIPYLLTGAYVIISIVSYFNFDIKKVENKLKDYKFNRLTEIYNVNEFLINDSFYTFFAGEIELMKYAKDNLDKEKKIEVLGTEKQILWTYPLLDYYYDYPEMDKYQFQRQLTYKHKNNEIIDNADYIICFYLSDFYRAYDKSKLENLEVIYENPFGKILKR